ncbi:hypothetical protein [Ruegeria arenilitoris]|uniref:hypothetical protein n=1 Tax=Ruegeria arenilitoris TaxID=1173585 RepID=UPI00147D3DDB|nr:hypothetical protein [Ruegeria arenilitoris]
MIRILSWVTGVLISGPVLAADIPTEVKAKLQSAMIAHVDGVMVDGAYTYLDTTTNEIATVYPANVHPMVIPAGGDYFVCSEMITEGGDTVTADFLVREISGDYKVVQMIVNNRAALQSAMKKIGN